MTDRRPPDFLLVGVPKAGTTALHAALAQHPGLHLSPVKEPKYYLCGDAPPPAYRGPGDAHSQQEWVWRRDDYLRLLDGGAPGALRGESTPFYLYSPEARRRIAADAPAAKLVVVLRDPVDRAYSNWMHLWMDGLEPVPDVVEALRREPERIAAGWAPFWHYAGLGRYGEQLDDLYGLFDREQVLVLRYRELVDEPGATLTRVLTFLGVPDLQVDDIPSDNTRGFVEHGLRSRVLGRAIRLGAYAGQFAPPEVWRAVSRPAVRLLHRGGAPSRPRLTPEQREQLIAPHREDVARLEEVTGQSFADWLTYRDGGTFASRKGG
ncbi:sulfotransferase [Nocardioides sp. ChNu-99]|uniref:sulfotransferase family protein n=1 Tax=Nocardioides sp. ChNu-99 TaxID=2839897 RepID=UPI002404D98F|nr:sulfotransferase [Nocardioides sp. ChNu-99]MDF9715709.1 sulfotransferase domain-containing protein [Nocardioides sp. ChNu-99]